MMLDLFAGLGGASCAMRERGWDVVTVDNDPRFGCTHTADLAIWAYTGPRPDLVWASPPCTEFSRESMPWCRTGNAPSVELAKAAQRIISQADPDWWVIENVRGAVKWLTPFMGAPKASYGPFFLWGSFPPFRATVRPFKEKLSSRQRAERAKVPECLSIALAEAVEGASVFTKGIA
jgi:site-specific DNA-cytosine methylase